MHTLSIPHAFTSLLQSAAPLPVLSSPLPTGLAVRALMAHAHQHGPLPLLGAWRLHPSHARLLERTTGGSPAGGWAALASVLGGTPMMQVTNDGFAPMWSLLKLDEAQETQIQGMLIEALTVRMAPPNAAAGLFMLMGLNPIAGLHLARTIHDSLLCWEQRADLPLLLDLLERIRELRPLAHAFFGVPAAILEVLSMLDTTKSYALDDFAELLLGLTLHARDTLHRTLDDRGRAQTLLTDVHELDLDALRQRASDTVRLDLFDAFLLPAGIARRVESDRFCITPSARSLPAHTIFAYPSKDLCAAFFSDLLTAPGTQELCA